ncbi:hypothetical protein ACFVFQ_31525 [Streptomyces sp. NPDC057743]
MHSGTNFTITVTTPQPSGMHQNRIALPKDRAADPTKRWPMTY